MSQNIFDNAQARRETRKWIGEQEVPMFAILAKKQFYPLNFPEDFQESLQLLPVERLVAISSDRTNAARIFVSDLHRLLEKRYAHKLEDTKKEVLEELGVILTDIACRSLEEAGRLHPEIQTVIEDNRLLDSGHDASQAPVLSTLNAHRGKALGRRSFLKGAGTMVGAAALGGGAMDALNNGVDRNNATAMGSGAALAGISQRSTKEDQVLEAFLQRLDGMLTEHERYAPAVRSAEVVDRERGGWKKIVYRGPDVLKEEKCENPHFRGR